MAACDIALELLETILHSVLYLRKLYPEAIFRKRQKYRIPVHMSVHKGVNEYVSASVRALRPYLERRLLESVSVVVTDPAGRHFETLAVELRVLDAAAICARDDPCLARLEASLSGLLLGLSATLGDCDPPPAGSTFQLQAAASRCLPESLDAAAEFPLTITDSAAPHGPTAAAEDGPGTEGCSVLPVRSVRNELFALEVTLRRPTG
ncbi:mitotic spindle assembly checkpoint protein MAD2B-like [Amphibalanus amphitrite]|uniref:mitotic spindle assembly checkpoint protein MAD2B-like n=1 Tax=Amphibalanus amphitrite TaxID=1232801 RepID=UPI001C8FA81B|nr:mitotic spindle assembly checkpoint protein MAD2B-like [Amphibalanus amphitrite]XP_043245155.1 mitotic spindle assembly checkpoint protein MAD2B-like [Amphibalanus amphitrite]